MVDRLTNSTGFGLVHRLGHHGAVRPAGVAVCERSDLALATVMARRGAETALAAKVREVFGVDLPMTAHRTASANIAFIWAGPGQWLAMTGSSGNSDTYPPFNRIRCALAGGLPPASLRAGILPQREGSGSEGSGGDKPRRSPPRPRIPCLRRDSPARQLRPTASQGRRGPVRP